MRTHTHTHTHAHAHAHVHALIHAHARTHARTHAEGRPSHVDANSDAVTHEGIVKAYTDYFLLGTVLVET
jgi:hypothetical protein